MSDYLPREIWRKIFTRLPVKSILQMRLVCKQFHQLISDPAFITAHIKKSENNQKLLHRHFTDKNRKKKHHYLMLNDEGPNIDVQNSEVVKFPFEVSQNPRYWIVGSFHGLVCVCKDYLAADQIVLWNPAIRKWLCLPKQEGNNCGSNSYSVLGFGFDPNTNDYKVVKLTFLRENIDGCPPRGELFSLSSRSWRTLTSNNVDAPRQAIDGASSFVIPENRWPQTYLNGAVHWIGYEPNRIALGNQIISFDVSNESFGKMMLPDALPTKNALELSVLKNKLSVVELQMNSRQEQLIIWVMEKYGQASSWTKLHTIDSQAKITKVIGFRKNGEVIMATKKGNLIIYNPENQRRRNISGMCGAHDSFFLVHYTDSLVLLDETGAASVG